MPVATNASIRPIVMDTEFRQKVTGCIIRAAEAIFVRTDPVPTDPEKAWAATVLRDSSLLHDRRSSLVNSFAEAIVSGDMTANVTRTPQQIADMTEDEIDAYLVTYIPFLSSN